MSIETIFTTIYQNNKWGGKESRSGKGSDTEQTRKIKTELINLIRSYNIGSIVDVACGDLNWMQTVLQETKIEKYVGLDIVKPLIEENKRKLPQYEFFHRNVVDEPFPYVADLIICRDVFVHLKFEDIQKVLKKIAKSGSKFLLLTTFTGDRQNLDIPQINTVTWRTLSFHREPFCFPEPVMIINEGCTETDSTGGYSDKSLALYKVSDLRKMYYPNAVQVQTEWHLKKIPKIVYFYWGNEKLPFLRYMTVYSFWKMNPDWQIVFYQPQNRTKSNTWKTHEHSIPFSGRCYMEELRKLPIDFRTVPADFYPDYPEVYKSDILRWILLSESGGLWSDMDVLFFKPMTALHLNTPQNKELDSICNFFYWGREPIHSIGFLLSGGKSSTYYTHIRQKALKHNPNFADYQTLGNHQIHNEFRDLAAIQTRYSVQSISKDTVYSYFSNNNIVKLFKGYNDLTTAETIGIHWYAGHPLAGEFVNKVNDLNFREINNILTEKMKTLL